MPFMGFGSVEPTVEDFPFLAGPQPQSHGSSGQTGAPSTAGVTLGVRSTASAPAADGDFMGFAGISADAAIEFAPSAVSAPDVSVVPAAVAGPSSPAPASLGGLQADPGFAGAEYGLIDDQPIAFEPRLGKEATWIDPVDTLFWSSYGSAVDVDSIPQYAMGWQPTYFDLLDDGSDWFVL